MPDSNPDRPRLDFPPEYAARIEAIIRLPLDENGEATFKVEPGTLAEAHQELWFLKQACDDLDALRTEVNGQLNRLHQEHPHDERRIAGLLRVVDITSALIAGMQTVVARIEADVLADRLPDHRA